MPEQLLGRLAELKRAGVPFDEAWRLARYRLYTAGFERRLWREVLADPVVVDAWRAAYEDRWTPLVALAGLDADELVAGLRSLIASGEPLAAAA